MRNSLAQIASDSGALNDGCSLSIMKCLLSLSDLGCAAGQQKCGVSRLGLSNNHHEIIAVVYTANFASVITEELTHAARQHEMRNSLGQIVGDIGALNEGCSFILREGIDIVERSRLCSWITEIRNGIDYLTSQKDYFLHCEYNSTSCSFQKPCLTQLFSENSFIRKEKR